MGSKLLRRMPDLAYFARSLSRFVGRVSFLAAASALLFALCADSNLPVAASPGIPWAQDSPPLHEQQSLNPAQDSSSPKSAPPVPPADPAKPVLADGTPVRLRFVRTVDSSLVIAGENEPLEVVEPVLVGNLVVIPMHSQAQATVMLAQAKRTEGRGGNLQMKIESIRLADGEPVPVRAVKDEKGAGHHALILTGAATGFAYTPASPLVLLLYMKGKNAITPAGTEITAYVIGDHPLDPSRFVSAGKKTEKKDAPE